MNAQSRGIVVAAIDPSEASEAVMEAAPRLARALHATELHFVYVIDASPPQLRDLGPPVVERDDARRFVERATEAAGAQFDGRIVGHVRLGPVRSEILSVLGDLEADLLVLGAHPRPALERMLVGSVSRSLSRTAPCPVFVARPKRYPQAPAIEPPCPACVEVERESGGKVTRCAQHERHRLTAHLHYEAPPSFGGGSMFLRGE